jgi:lysophospholipase L1-like esterase
VESSSGARGRAATWYRPAARAGVDRREVACRVALVLVVCLVALGLAETMLRFAEPRRLEAPVPGRYYLWPPYWSQTFRPEPGRLPGVGPYAHFQVNSQGIRGPEWSVSRAQEYRILAVGGSTTECLYLDQDKAWPALLGRGLGRTVDGRGVWVGNLGRSGRTTRDHLALARLALEQYDVDALVMLVGANDLLLRLSQAEEYDPHFVDDIARFHAWALPRFAIVPETSTADAPWFARTAVGRLARQLQQRFRPLVPAEPVVIPADAYRQYEWLRERRHQANRLVVLPGLDDALDEYARNVEAIVAEARRRGLRVVLLTQPALWKPEPRPAEERWLWMGWRGRVEDSRTYYAPGALAGGLARYNRRLLGLCDRLAVECVDLTVQVPSTIEAFYDDLHFNEAGARLVAATVVGHFAARPPFAGRRARLKPPVTAAGNPPTPSLLSTED